VSYCICLCTSLRSLLIVTRQLKQVNFSYVIDSSQTLTIIYYHRFINQNQSYQNKNVSDGPANFASFREGMSLECFSAVAPDCETSCNVNIKQNEKNSDDVTGTAIFTE